MANKGKGKKNNQDQKGIIVSLGKVEKVDNHFEALVEVTVKTKKGDLHPECELLLYRKDKPDESILPMKTGADTPGNRESGEFGSVKMNLEFALEDAEKEFEFFIKTSFDAKRSYFKVCLPELDKFSDQIHAGIRQKKLFPFIAEVLFLSGLLLTANIIVRNVSPIFLSLAFSVFVYHISQKILDDRSKSIIASIVILIISLLMPWFIHGAVSWALFLLLFPGMIFYALEELTGRNLFPWALLKWIMMPMIGFCLLMVFISPFLVDDSLIGIYRFRLLSFNLLPNWIVGESYVQHFVNSIYDTLQSSLSRYSESRTLFIFVSAVSSSIFWFLLAVRWLIVGKLIFLVTIPKEAIEFFKGKKDALKDKEPSDRLTTGYLIALNWVSDFVKNRVFRVKNR